MSQIIRHIPHKSTINLADEVDYLKGQIVSKTLSQNPHYSLTLFAIDKDEAISTHDSKGDAMVQVLDGTGRFTIGESDYVLQAGETIVMPATIPHAVYGEEAFKMLLTVLF